ncbi:MAG TPA: hypothetical protein PL088_11800 [Spirochaetota bacterium]|nr:hypothetical protein [Spirochaetota bacterium]
MEREHSQPSRKYLELDLSLADLSIEEVEEWEEENNLCAVVYSKEHDCHYIHPLMCMDMAADTQTILVITKAHLDSLEHLMRSVADRDPHLTLSEFLSNRTDYQEEYDRAARD